jgi:hypothetical protein
VPVHSVVVLLRPQAAHANLSGAVRYAPRPGRGSMDFSYETARLWERPADGLLAGDLGVVPLAVLGRLPADLSLEDGLAAVVQRLVDRVLEIVRLSGSCAARVYVRGGCPGLVPGWFTFVATRRGLSSLGCPGLVPGSLTLAATAAPRSNQPNHPRDKPGGFRPGMRPVE